jgi:hypothetical protein
MKTLDLQRKNTLSEQHILRFSSISIIAGSNSCEIALFSSYSCSFNLSINGQISRGCFNSKPKCSTTFSRRKLNILNLLQKLQQINVKIAKIK